MNQFSELARYLRLKDEWRSITGNQLTVTGSDNCMESKKYSDAEKSRLSEILFEAKELHYATANK